MTDGMVLNVSQVPRAKGQVPGRRGTGTTTTGRGAGQSGFGPKVDKQSEIGVSEEDEAPPGGVAQRPLQIIRAGFVPASSSFFSHCHDTTRCRCFVSSQELEVWLRG